MKYRYGAFRGKIFTTNDWVQVYDSRHSLVTVITIRRRYTTRKGLLPYSLSGAHYFSDYNASKYLGGNAIRFMNKHCLLATCVLDDHIYKGSYYHHKHMYIYQYPRTQTVGHRQILFHRYI